MVLLVAPLVFRAPEAPAAREIATRELRSEWSISKPARALRPSGALHTSGVGLLCVPVGGGPPARRPRRELRSARRLVVRPGLATAHGPRSLAPWSLRSSGALHTSGAWPLWCRPWASQGPSELRFLADLLLVVTNVVNPTAFSLKIVVFGRRLTTFVTRVLARGFTLLRFDDVCNVVCPPALRPGTPAPPVVCVFWIGSSVVDRNGASG